jgi:hypothetical protein
MINTMDKKCSHKYVFMRNDSFYRSNGRYSYLYTSINYYFCEKCLDEKETKQEESFGDHQRHNLPDWAKSISKKVAGYE